MNAFEQGWNFALVKLGLSGSARSAVSGAAMKVPGIPKQQAMGGAPKAPSVPQPWSAQNQMEPKMHETAWQGAQKELDVGESRSMGKVDQWQQPKALPTGST